MFCDCICDDCAIGQHHGCLYEDDFMLPMWMLDEFDEYDDTEG